MREGEEKYPGFFTLHSMSFVGADRSDGQQRMAQSWRHIRQGLEYVLRSDPQVRPDVFDSDFARKSLWNDLFPDPIRSVTAQLRLLWYFGHDQKGAVLTPVRRGFSERKMNTVHQSRQTGGASSKK